MLSFFLIEWVLATNQIFYFVVISVNVYGPLKLAHYVALKKLIIVMHPNTIRPLEIENRVN